MRWLNKMYNIWVSEGEVRGAREGAVALYLAAAWDEVAL
jgi:hypothetical protein